MIKPPSGSQLLDGLNPAELKAVLQAAVVRRYSAHSVVLNQTQLSQRLLLLIQGRARQFFVTEEGNRILLRWLIPGDVAGPRALLPKLERYYVGTEALKNSRFLVWDRRTMDDLTTRYPRLRQNALYIADNYLGWFLTSHAALACFTGRQRCAAVLKSIAMIIGRRVPNGIEVEISNAELADASAVTLFDATRFLSKWRASGLIVKTRNKVLLRSLDSLAKEIRGYN